MAMDVVVIWVWVDGRDQVGCSKMWIGVVEVCEYRVEIRRVKFETIECGERNQKRNSAFTSSRPLFIHFQHGNHGSMMVKGGIAFDLLMPSLGPHPSQCGDDAARFYVSIALAFRLGRL